MKADHSFVLGDALWDISGFPSLFDRFFDVSELAAWSQDFVPHTTIPAPRMLERRLQSGSDPLLPQAEDGRAEIGVLSTLTL